MSDVYCPPPDPSDYLDNQIEYPTPEGKESTKSTDMTHNDINFDEPKVGKQESVQTNIEDDLAKIRAKKLQARIPSGVYSKSSKSQTTLRVVGDRLVKSGRTIHLTQADTLKKVVNEI